jgi:hypothetical protein
MPPVPLERHCEERSDEAKTLAAGLDCFAFGSQ